MEQEITRIPDYCTFPTTFKQTYKWWKPLVVALLTNVFYLMGILANTVVVAVMDFIDGKGLSVSIGLHKVYSGLDVFNAQGAIAIEGRIAWMLVAFILAVSIVKDRPFSSYSSSSGRGWSWLIFFKCFFLSLLVCGVPNAAYMIFLSGSTGEARFTIPGIVLCAVLVPIACVAQEYVFRGLLMQTFGSWFKVPIIAVVLQTVFFVSFSQYNYTGALELWIAGIGLGIAAWLAKGLEASVSFSLVNSMTIIFLAGFSFGDLKRYGDYKWMFVSFACYVIYILILNKMVKKHGLR